MFGIRKSVTSPVDSAGVVTSAKTLHESLVCGISTISPESSGVVTFARTLHESPVGGISAISPESADGAPSAISPPEA